MAAQGPEPWRLILFSLPRSRFQICTQGSGRFPVVRGACPCRGGEGKVQFSDKQEWSEAGQALPKGQAFRVPLA